jgi:cysteine desulfurase
VAGVAGFGRAAEIVLARLGDYARLAELRDDMERHIRQIAPKARAFGGGAPRLPNTSYMSMPGVRSDVQVMAFDLAGFAVSAGSACSSGKVSASHVLEAMGIAKDEAMTGVRVSMGWRTTKAEIDRFVEAWNNIYRRSGDRADAA